MADEKIPSQRLPDQLAELLRNTRDREAIIIEKLVDGRFAISTRRGDALSEIELREELAKTNSRADIIDGLVRRVKEEEWVKVADEKIPSQRLSDQLAEMLRNTRDREAIIIEKLVDGRFAISTRRGDALSEIELREELAKTNSRADIIDGLVRRVKEEEWVRVNTLRVARLPNGLSLWFCENGEVYTVPPRVGVTEIQDTLTQVMEWARASPHPHPEMVGLWLDAFEDQYLYLSSAMPRRQGREVGRESVRQIVQDLMAWSGRGSN